MPLSAKKKARIKAMGGRVTTVEEWLDLTPEEIAVIDMKIRLGEELKAHRLKKKLSHRLKKKLSQLRAGRQDPEDQPGTSVEAGEWPGHARSAGSISPGPRRLYGRGGACDLRLNAPLRGTYTRSFRTGTEPVQQGGQKR